MGYWFLLAIVVCALVAVVAAYVSEQDAAETAQTPPHPANRSIVWVALAGGDGVGEGTPNPGSDNWVSQLAATLPAHVCLGNLSVGGATSATSIRDQLPVALTMQPDIVTVWLVMSDIASDSSVASSQQCLKTMLDRFAKAGCRMIVGNAFVAATDDAAMEQTRTWNAAVAEVAATCGATLVDLESISDQLVGHILPPGTDPTRLDQVGHRLLAGRFRPAISAAIEAIDSAPR